MFRNQAAKQFGIDISTPAAFDSPRRNTVPLATHGSNNVGYPENLLEQDKSGLYLKQLVFIEGVQLSPPLFRRMPATKIIADCFLSQDIESGRK